MLSATLDRAHGRTLPAGVAEALAAGRTVLTAGRRAAHALRALLMAEEGVPSAEPQVFALDGWLTGLWRQMTLAGTADRMLLNATQEQRLWRGIVATDEQLPALRDADALAELAAEAYRTLHLGVAGLGLVDVRQRLARSAHGVDSRALLRWTESFDRTVRRQLLLPAAGLAGALAEALAAGDVPMPDAGLLLVDFDEMLPAHRHLFGTIERAGFPLRSLDTGLPATQEPSLYAAPDTRTEVEAAAAGLRDRLRADPGARLAVIVPDLEARRREIDRVFGRVLAPELSGLSTAPEPWEFSLGVPLAETPYGSAGLGLLRLALGPQSLQEIGDLLLSVHFGSGGPLPEQLAAAEFEALDLRGARLLRPELSLGGLVSLLERSGRAGRMPGLLGQLHRLERAARELAGVETRAFSGWADLFRTLLDAAGHTATAGRSSLAFQVDRRWQSALDELATLDFDGSRVDAAESLRLLDRIARATTFAPENRGAPIQVLGPLEVGGVCFDGLWFLSAGDLSWPPGTVPNPLIPPQLARAMALPGADTARDHARACELTARIGRSAPQVVFSYARVVEDGEQHPSPALEALVLLPSEPPVPEPHAAPGLPLAWERFADDQPIPPPPEGRVGGGATVLALQAACGFRAFAELRLHSWQPEPVEAGMDARERGSVVHRVMETFWRELGGQQALARLPVEERTRLLDQSIDAALEQRRRSARDPWDQGYLDLQAERLRRLLRPWMTEELSRPPFTVRASEAAARDQELGPLRLSVRVDRVDETPEGIVILDYKTGAAETGGWLSERPDAPQLPLYAVLAGEPVAGLAFAALRAGNDLKLKGFADSDRVFGKTARMPATMDQLLEGWHSTLVELATQFFEGRAAAAPKQYPGTCTHCAQRILCRLRLDEVESCEDELEAWRAIPGDREADVG